MPRPQEYPRRCYPAAPFCHRIGIKRGSGGTGGAFFRLIGLGHARKLFDEKANEECRGKCWAETPERRMEMNE